MAPSHSVARYREIAEILVSNGLAALAGQTGLLGQVPESLRRRAGGPDAADGSGAPGPVPGPVRLRQALEQLGPTFMKLGQMLATRDDLLPAAYTEELTRLQDHAPPAPYEQIAQVVREELGTDPLEAFEMFEEAPLATASIGQAHRARTLDGTEVVVKVRKPGVEDIVAEDLGILRHLAGIADREWETARDVDVEGLASAFDRSMRRELDYRAEAANAQRFAADLAEDPVVRIPRVFTALSTSRVLTEEFAAGMRITDREALDAAGVDRPALARAATRSIVKMVLVDGFFHADPHPGNMFVREDGCIWLIDFGMVGELSRPVREDIVRLTFSLARHDSDGVAASLLRLAPPQGPHDARRFDQDVQALLDTLEGHALADISLSAFFEKLTTLLRRHRLQLPADVSTLLRMLVLTESSAVLLDPTFHISAVLEEVLPVALAQIWGPQALLTRLGESGMQALRLGEEAPARVRRMLDDYESRGVAVHIGPDDLAPLVERIEATGDRIVAGVTMGAMLVGVGRVAAAGVERSHRGLRDPLMLAAGGATLVLGAYLAAGAGPARSLARMVTRRAR